MASSDSEPDTVRTFTCYCGAVMPLDDADAHVAQHGIEADTYRGAQLRKFLREAGSPIEADDQGDAEIEP